MTTIELDAIPGFMPQCNRDALDALIVEHDIRTVVEVGSFLGLSAGWFALWDRIERVTCIDVWQDNPKVGIPVGCYDQFLGNMHALGVAHKIGTVRGDSSLVHERVPPADLVYIDGDHTYTGCASDIKLYGPKALKILCGDDYIRYDYYRVIEAVDQLLPQRQVSGQFWWVVK